MYTVDFFFLKLGFNPIKAIGLFLFLTSFKHLQCSTKVCFLNAGFGVCEATSLKQLLKLTILTLYFIIKLSGVFSPFPSSESMQNF